VLFRKMVMTHSATRRRPQNKASFTRTNRSGPRPVRPPPAPSWDPIVRNKANRSRTGTEDHRQDRSLGRCHASRGRRAKQSQFPLTDAGERGRATAQAEPLGEQTCETKPILPGLGHRASAFEERGYGRSIHGRAWEEQSQFPDAQRRGLSGRSAFGIPRLRGSDRSSRLKGELRKAAGAWARMVMHPIPSGVCVSTRFLVDWRFRSFQE
jgi:hypothetical protein